MLWTLGCMYLFELVFLFFWDYIPRSGIAGSYGSSIFSCFFIWETTILFSTVAVPIYIPINSVWRFRASLVAQWLRICLPMQGTWVRALVWEDPTCCGAAGPVRHDCWACTLEPASHNYWARKPQLLKPARLEPVLHRRRGHCNEKPTHSGEEWPPLATAGEGPLAAMKTQRSQK